MIGRPVFDDEAQREELRRRLSQVLSVEIPEDAIARRPTFPLAELSDENRLRDFLEVWDWYLQEIPISEST